MAAASAAAYHVMAGGPRASNPCAATGWGSPWEIGRPCTRSGTAAGAGTTTGARAEGGVRLGENSRLGAWWLLAIRIDAEVARGGSDGSPACPSASTPAVAAGAETGLPGLGSSPSASAQVSASSAESSAILATRHEVAAALQARHRESTLLISDCTSARLSPECRAIPYTLSFQQAWPSTASALPRMVPQTDEQDEAAASDRSSMPAPGATPRCHPAAMRGRASREAAPAAVHKRSPEKDTGSRKARRGLPVSFVHTLGCHSPCRCSERCSTIRAP